MWGWGANIEPSRARAGLQATSPRRALCSTTCHDDSTQRDTPARAVHCTGVTELHSSMSSDAAKANPPRATGRERWLAEGSFRCPLVRVRGEGEEGRGREGGGGMCLGDLVAFRDVSLGGVLGLPTCRNSRA